MGYTTDFEGAFTVEPPLKEEHRAYLEAFNKTRRMDRRAFKTAKRPDPIREAAGLPLGQSGAYFVGEAGYAGQDHGDDIVNYNRPPAGQPGLWCQWTPTDDGTAIVWDGGEKFYDYVEWLEYLIRHFLRPWGYTLNGTMQWWGEDRGDVGRIVVEDNRVSTRRGHIMYEGEEVL